MISNFPCLHQNTFGRNQRLQRVSNVHKPLPQCLTDCRALVWGTFAAATEQRLIWPCPLGHRSPCNIVQKRTTRALQVDTRQIELLCNSLASGKPDPFLLEWHSSPRARPRLQQIVDILLSAAVCILPKQKNPPRSYQVLQPCGLAVWFYFYRLCLGRQAIQ